MKKQIIYLLLTLFAFAWQGNAQCNYTLEMNDSWGDGWNGNTMDVLVNGTVVLDDVTLDNGSQGTMQFLVNTGDDISTVWNGGGSYGNETSYRILDADGIEVAAAAEADIPPGTITATCPTCPAPDNLTVVGTTSDSADLSWVDYTGGAIFTVEWREVGSTTWNSATTAAGATSYTLTGLNSHTQYEWQLTADCGGGDTSNTTAGPSFWTACNTVDTFPYDYGFEDTYTNSEADWSPSCWSANPENTGSGQYQGPYRWTPNNDATPSTNTGPSAAHSGMQYAYTEASGSNGGDVAELFSPIFDLSSLTDPQLVFFYHMYGDDMGELHVDTYNGTTWTTDVWTMVGPQQTDNADPWLKAYVTLPTDVTQIKFRAIRGADYNSDIAIDDITIRETPLCPEATNLSVDALTTATADVSWTDNTGGTATYIIEWRETGATAWNSDTVAAGTTTYQITGLTERTDYEWQLTTDCGATGTSPVVTGPGFYTWYCDSVPSSNDGNGITNVQLGATNYPNPDVTYNDFTTTGPVEDLPQGEMVNLQITFETGFTYYTNVWIDLNDDLVFDNATELFFQGESLSDNPTTLDASFIMPSNAPLGNHVMRIGTADTGQSTPDPCYNGSWGVTLDFMINVTVPPTCPAPSDLAVNNVSDTSADLSWTDNSNGNATYVVEWREVGAATWNSDTTAAGATSYTLSGLTAHTDYEWQLHADCGGGDISSTRIGPAFQTLCDVVSTFPYTYGFEDVTANTGAEWDASCWSGNPENTGSGSFNGPFRWTPADDATPSSNTGPTGPHSGNLYAYTEASGSNAGDVAELISPLLDLSSLANGVEMSFYYYMYGADMGELHIDTYDGTAWTNDVWTMVGQQQTSDTEPWIQAFVLFPNNVTKVRFRAVRGSDYHSDIAIDDISIYEAPTCPQPTNLSVGNTGGDYADLSWTDNTNGNGSYVIEYREIGSATWNTATTAAGATSYTITGLSPLTGYEWQLHADCGGGDTSFVSTGPNFYTGCMTVDTFPYTYGFEDVFTNTGGDWTLSCWSGNPQNTNADASSGPFRWTSFNGQTPTSDTGPEMAHSGTQYAYTEASGSNYGDIAELISPDFDMSSMATPELSFYYHMYGDDIGGLHVDTYDGNTWTNDVWVLYGPQQADMSDPWTLVVLPIDNTVTKIKFRATRGNGPKGDMAIDDISIHGCRTPSDLAIDNLSTTSVDLTWTDNTGGNASYIVEWREVGATSWNSDTTAVGATSYHISGLTSHTEYEWQITADCGTGGSGLPVGSTFYTWYCDSTPVSNDGNGITNVRVRYHTYVVDDVPYKDLTNEMVVELKTGDTADMDVTFETGVAYAVNIWIDYNDNLTFDTDELVFSGQCTTDIPSLVDTSFMVDANANLGEHIMRIGSRDATLYPNPDPCFNDYWGVTIDLKVNIVDVLAVNNDATFSLNLYPNPASDILNVTADKDIQNLQVFDLLGQEVINVQPNDTQYSISVDNLKAGTYVVRVIVNGKTGFYRFIKN